MKVLVACEFSGTVRDAFLDQGHDAVSCDFEPTESEGPHIQGDVLEVLDQGWDLMVAHPPCTYLCNSGVRWLHEREGRWGKMREAARFFESLLECEIPRVCIENPVMHKYAVGIIGRRQDQTIQPYEFGHPESKRTCLWLKNLPLLEATNVLEEPENGVWENQTPSGQNKLSPSSERSKSRSRTYTGIAEAMAKQWTTDRARQLAEEP